MDPPAGQPPQQEAVHGAERQVAAPGHIHCAGVFQYPGGLGGGEVGVYHQAAARRHHRLVPGGGQLGAAGGGASVLPDDGVVDGGAGAAVPDDCGFPLVGDADGGRGGGACQDLAAGGYGIGPDHFGIVLDPAVPRVDLRQRTGRRTQDFAVPAEQDGAGGGRTLVNCQDRRCGHSVRSSRCAVRLRPASAALRLLVAELRPGRRVVGMPVLRRLLLVQLRRQVGQRLAYNVALPDRRQAGDGLLERRGFAGVKRQPREGSLLRWSMWI